MAIPRVSTGDYPMDGRIRLGRAVTSAREDAGWLTRQEFADYAHVSLRRLASLENPDGEPPVGWRVLGRVARALPGWTEDTPRIILEGGPAPLNEAPAEAAAPAPRPRPRPEVPNKGDLTEEELEFMWALSKSGFSAEETVEMVRQRRAREQKPSGVDVGQVGENGS